MDALVLPDPRFLDQQFNNLEVFLGGTSTIYHHLQKGSMAGTNIKVTATEIMKNINKVYKKSNEVHPHIIQCTNLLTDTIFSVQPEFLTQNPDKQNLKLDKKDVKEFMKTTQPLFDKEEKSNMNRLLKNLKAMIQEHKECIYEEMEKEAKTFYSLKERVEWRQYVIRQRFSDLDNISTSESDVEYTLLTDLKLNLYKQAFRIMGFQALKRHAKIMEKKAQLEYEMKQTEHKIISAIETPLKERLEEAMTQLIWIHKQNCISQYKVYEIQQNIMKLANGFSKVICDIRETNSTQYRFEPSSGENTRSDFMRNVRNMDGFLMGRIMDECTMGISKCETKHYGLQQSVNFTDDFKKYKSFRNCRTIKVDQSMNPELTKTKEKVKLEIIKDNIVFGWTKASMFSSKKKYGFFLLNDEMSC